MNQRFLQTEFWAAFKSRYGWNPLFFVFDDDNKISQVDSYAGIEDCSKCITVLIRCFSLKIKKFSIAYIPMAPESRKEQTPDEFCTNLEYISEKIKNYLPQNTVFIRFDPALDFYKTEERDSFVYNFIHSDKKNTAIRKSESDIQPPDTVILNLAGSEKEILASMKSKWRYNIRLAEKKGVEVKSYTANDIDFSTAFEDFYRLFMQTSERDGVQFHQKKYYLDLLNLSAESKEAPLVRLYIARHENDCLAGIITLFCKREAVYLYGASGNIKRNFMPAYLLQWTAIRDAKKHGCPVYDFYGCPPTEDEKHPMHGLYLFKTGFGGTLVHRPGSFDVILKKNIYTIYIYAEKARAFFFKVIKKKLAGR